ncbi:MAG: hypothetical protein COA37_10615 [Hoeflea sp.]|nr:MAG: hypothetical protein COA37_10615 [Hoeflea sp.]
MAARVTPVFSLTPQSLAKCVRAICLVAVGIVLFAPIFPARADEPPREMTFSIVRSSNSLCEPDCPEWIAADGNIADKTADAFKAILKKAGDRNLPLLINSLGGRVDVAMAMGRLIRDRGMTVEIARTDFSRCKPWDKECKPDLKDGTYYGYANLTFGVCNSACPLMLASGVRRIVGPFSRVGVHQIVTTRHKYRDKYRIYKKTLSSGKVISERKFVERELIGTVKSTDLPKSLRRELTDYLTSMDVSPKLIDLMVATPPEDIRYLSMKELKTFGVVTEISEIEELVGYRICKGRSRPENCAVRD